MRNPVRSETDAFYIAFGAALLLGASALLGVLIAPVAGIALCVGAVAGVLVWEFATKDPERRRPLREAALAGRGAVRERPVFLLVANRTLGDRDLRAEIRRRAQDGAELRILAPILVSRARYLASDVDGELRDARRRLKAALAWADAEGIAATGVVGDPNAAFDAIEDELRLHAAEEVIVSTLPKGESNWLETGILERLRDELEIPVTHVIAHRTPSHA
jgi:membrane protein implicated in regulation of membrane protease activity